MAPEGLSEREVEERRADGRVNSAESPVSRSYTDILVKNLCTSFNLILLILGLALVFFEEYINAVAATAIILINVLVSTVQEMRAKRRLDRIALLLRPKATVVRGGEERTIDPAGIVMDDVVLMVPGDQAQVDGVVIDCRSFEMDESLLTGESSTRRKQPGDTVHSGAFCVTGECHYRVTALGEDTFAAKMLSSAKRFDKKRTPLQRETASVTEMLMGIAFFYLGIVVVMNLLAKKPAVDSLIQAVIILDIVPIALFLLITLTYMIAAVRMADSGVLLQNASSVEAMSHVDTVCMDKTGTITTNNLLFDNAVYYTDEAEAREAVRAIVSATTGRNNTVKALEREYGTEAVVTVAEVPFSSQRRFSAVQVRRPQGDLTVFMGAYPVLAAALADAGIGGTVAACAARGLRTVVVGIADGPLSEDPEAELPSLRPAAVIGIRDEIRPDCREIIGRFIDGGMELKVISGDDPETVEAIFTQAGIPGGRVAVSGDDLALMDADGRREAVLRSDILGRMRPDQKEEAVSILKADGRYVAMVGDGVNDVRSIKAAQVGVALQSGSGAARGVADMVLMDDRFDALPKAIVEGKRTVSGMRDILRLYLTRNFVLAILVGILLLIFRRMPMLPIQNSYYALITVSFAAFLMTLWAKPSDDRERVLPGVLRFSVPMAMTIAAFAMGIYALFYFGVPAGLFPEVSFDLTADAFFSLFPDATRADLISHLSGLTDAPDTVAVLAETAAMNAMLIFLVVAGILQLFLIYPPFGFMSRDRRPKRRILPMLLAVLLFTVMVLFYGYPPLSVGVASVMYLPDAVYLLVLAVSAAWFAVAVVLNRSDRRSMLVEFSERSFEKQLRRELEKEGRQDQRGR